LAALSSAAVRRFGSEARDGDGPAAALAVEEPIVLGGAKNALDVVLRFGERDVVDEFVFLETGPLSLPSDDAAFAGIVASERVVDAAELLDEAREVERSNPDVGFRIRQHRRREAADT